MDNNADGKKKYILIYEGGASAKDQAGRKMQMEAWDKWFGGLGSDLVDGGFPFMTGAMMTDGKAQMKSEVPVSGYSIIKADNYKAAMAKAMTCPVTMAGAKIHVFEAASMM